MKEDQVEAVAAYGTEVLSFWVFPVWISLKELRGLRERGLGSVYYLHTGS